MKRRIPKTPATVLGDELRKTAIAYKADGQGERAEGLIDAANRVDAFLFAETKSSLARGPVVSAPSSIEERLAALEENLGHLAALVASGQRKPPETPPPIVRAIPAILRPPVKTRAPTLNGASHPATRDPLSRCERKILTAGVQLAGIGLTSPSEEVLLLLTGYRLSGSWSAAMASLRASGFLDGTVVTADGVHALGRVEALPRGDALVTYWEGKLGRCPGAILRYVLALGDPASEEDVLEATGYRMSGSWSAAVSELRKLHLLTPRGDFRIPEETRALLVDP